MAIDSAQKRSSAVLPLLGALRSPGWPTGLGAQAERQQGAWTYSGILADAPSEEVPTAGGGGRPMPSRHLPGEGPRRKKLTLKRRRDEEETPEPPLPRPEPVIDLAKIRTAIEKLADDEEPITTLAEILPFVPREPALPDEPDTLTRQDIQDVVLLTVVPMLRQLERQIADLNEKAPVDQKMVDQLRLRSELESEQARKAKLLLLLVQLLVLLNE